MSSSARKGDTIDLSIDVQDLQGRALLIVSGELDLYTAPDLRDAVIEAIDGGNTGVVLDIAAVGFIDSTGLGALVGCLKRTREHGGSLTIVAPETSPLHKLMTLTGLEDALPVRASLEDVTG